MKNLGDEDCYIECIQVNFYPHEINTGFLSTELLSGFKIILILKNHHFKNQQMNKKSDARTPCFFVGG